MFRNNLFENGSKFEKVYLSSLISVATIIAYHTLMTLKLHILFSLFAIFKLN